VAAVAAATLHEFKLLHPIAMKLWDKNQKHGGRSDKRAPYGGFRGKAHEIICGMSVFKILTEKVTTV